MFSKTLETQRCVIPSTGFYEWEHDEKGKVTGKYLFSIPGERMLYMAGLFRRMVDAKGVTAWRYTIITTEANESRRPFHDRMPTILSPGEVKDWIENHDCMRDILSRVGLGDAGATAVNPNAHSAMT